LSQVNVTLGASLGGALALAACAAAALLLRRRRRKREKARRAAAAAAAAAAAPAVAASADGYSVANPLRAPEPGAARSPTRAPASAADRRPPPPPSTPAPAAPAPALAPAAPARSPSPAHPPPPRRFSTAWSRKRSRVYYVSEDSGESHWVLPAGGVVVPPALASAPAAAPAAAPTADAPAAPAPPPPAAAAAASDTLVDEDGTLWQARFSASRGVHYVDAGGRVSAALPAGAARAPPELQFSALPHHALSTAPQPSGGRGYAKAWSATRSRAYYVSLDSGHPTWVLPPGAKVHDSLHEEEEP